MYHAISRATVLRNLIKTEKVICAPGVGDALGARMAENAGFKALMVSGSSMSNILLGTSDVGILSYGELRNNFVNIVNATNLPIIADADTGYGGTLPIYRMVREYEAIGIAGIQIEDQTFPKMCAYYSNTTVVSVEEMCDRIRAACEARRNPDFLIIARTDASRSLGIDEAIRRLKLYYEAGADMLFASVPPTVEDMKKIAEIGVPVCTSIVEGTPNENLTVEELGNMGFKIVKFPQTLIRASMKAMYDALNTLQTDGTTAAIRHTLCTQKHRAENTAMEEYSCFESFITKKASMSVVE